MKLFGGYVTSNKTIGFVRLGSEELSFFKFQISLLLTKKVAKREGI